MEFDQFVSMWWFVREFKEERKKKQLKEKKFREKKKKERGKVSKRRK